MADHTVYDQIFAEEKQTPFTLKEIVQISDNNNGDYTRPIQIDTTPIANRGNTFANYAEGVLIVPYVITFKSDHDITAGGVANSFMVGLKNGYYSIISSMLIYNENQAITRETDDIARFINWRILSTWDDDTLKKNGSLCGISFDTAGSQSFNTVASSSGIGLSANNLSNPTTNNLGAYVLASRLWGATVPQNTINQGLYDRLLNTAYPSVGYGGNFELGAAGTSLGVDKLGKNYFIQDAGVGAARLYQFTIAAIIPLRVLHPYFEVCGLQKNATYQFTITINSFQVVVPITFTAINAGVTPAFSVMGLTSTTSLSGTTCPLQILSCFNGNPMTLPANTPAGNSVITVCCGVGAGTAPPITNQIAYNLAPMPINNAQIWVPMYTMVPSVERDLLTVLPRRTIKYQDVYATVVSNIGPGNNISSIVKAAVCRPLYIVVIPTLNSASNANFVSRRSPFSPSPMMEAPNLLINYFNVSINGRNIWDTSRQYLWEEYLSEVSKINCLGGSEHNSSTSGLLSSYDWTNGYSAYVAALSRYVHDDKPVSISITGINMTSSQICNYHVYLVYEREITIDTLTGSVSE